jgi:hypothetical protein
MFSLVRLGQKGGSYKGYLAKEPIKSATAIRTTNFLCLKVLGRKEA